MTTETASTNNANKAREACTHHWILEPADGPSSHGRCKHCGRERTFSNSMEAASEELAKSELANTEVGANPDRS